MRINNSASVLDAEMMAILMALLNATRHRKKSIIHTDSLTAVQTQKKTLKNGDQLHNQSNKKGRNKDGT